MSKKYLGPLNNFKNMYIFLYSNRKSLFKEFKWVWTQMRFRPETLTCEIRERSTLANVGPPFLPESQHLRAGLSAETPGRRPGGSGLRSRPRCRLSLGALWPRLSPWRPPWCWASRYLPHLPTAHSSGFHRLLPVQAVTSPGP